MTGVLTFAFVAGSVATANPCGFALLPAFLARQLGDSGSTRGADAVARALGVSALTTAGFLLVFGSFGAVISLGGRWLIQAVPWVALAVGIALFIAGILVLGGRHIRVRLPVVARRSAGGGRLSAFAFGVGYGVASLSCTLPIFLAVVGTAVTGDALTSGLASVAYAAGMGTILTALAVATALSRAGVARAIRRLLPYVTRLSGAMLVAAGAFVVYYWTFFLLPGAERRQEPKPIAISSDLSSRLQMWLGGSTGKTLTAVLGGLTALLVVWALARQARRWREARRGGPGRDVEPLAGRASASAPRLESGEAMPARSSYAGSRPAEKR